MKKNNLIIMIIVILVVLIITILQLVNYIKAISSNDNTNTASIDVVSENTNTDKKTIEGVIVASGSKYLDKTDKGTLKIFVEFKYDLYDENGKSMKRYFYDLIGDLVPLIEKSFYLVDESKNIEIRIIYKPETDEYTVKINSLKDFYDETDGEDYVNLANTKIVEKSNLFINNVMLNNLVRKNMFMLNSEYSDKSRVDMGNDYYSYNDGAMYAKLLGGRVFNTVFTQKYDEEVAKNIKVGTSLSEINDQVSNLGFGSVNDGYLGYRTEDFYAFFYNDEISVYQYNYDENEYFDKYLSEYCSTGNLQKLYEDFNEWDSYFEKEYDPESGRFKITFPARGIDIDIYNNDSKGIKIYSNYYLTDTIKQLVKTNKITLEGKKDLIHITEIARRETMR